MDGFMSAIKRLTLSTNYARWSPAFSRMVHQVSAHNVAAGSRNILTLHERIVLLRKLDPYIKQPCFNNTDENEILQAKEDLLLLWEYLLEFVVVMSKPPIKELGYVLIVVLMQREEFTLRKLGFGSESSSPHCSTPHIRLANRYKVLLLQTFMLVMKSMTAKGKFAEIIHFSAQTLVVFFFRLPLVGGRVIDALEKKAAAQRLLEGGIMKCGGALGIGPSPDKQRGSLEDNKVAPTDDDNKSSDIAAEGCRSDCMSASSGDQSNGTSTETTSINSTTETAPATSDSTSAMDSSTSPASSSSSPWTSAVPLPNNAIVGKVASNTEKLESISAKFIMNNPDLFQWNYFNSEAEASALGPRVLNDDNACLAWLSSKETFFLTFAEVYVHHVESVATRPVLWSVIPAYDLILECFWPLLKSSMWWDGICKRKTNESNGWVSSLPAYMRVKRTALALISNKSLINPFIKFTFECTNLHSLLSVDSCVEHLNLWISSVAYSRSAREAISNHNQNSRNTPPKQGLLDKNKNGRDDDGSGDSSEEQQLMLRPSLPESFDYDTYWFGIKHLLTSELFQILLKVCSLLYNTLHLFNGQLRTRFVNDLMNDCFFSLFLHWSSEVRTFFQLTLVYKVLRSDRRNLPCFTDAQVIRDYGTQAQETSLTQRINSHSRRFSFDDSKVNGGNDVRDEFNVPPNVYSGEVSFERRMAIFDNTNTSDNEDLLLDIMFCSKIDAFVRMCLDGDVSIPEQNRPYIKSSLQNYASLLKQYYKGVVNDFMESLPSLAHRMIYSEFTNS